MKQLTHSNEKHEKQTYQRKYEHTGAGKVNLSVPRKELVVNKFEREKLTCSP